MRLKDQKNSYGWVSIATHWLVATIIFTLWFIGDSISFFDSRAERGQQRLLHISLAVCAYGFLWFRIGWRFFSKHPRLDGQGRLDHWIANTAHYLMLAAVALMLISGPLIVWSRGTPIHVFDWFSIASPIGSNLPLNEFCEKVHSISANTLLVIVLLHISGAFKHLMFSDNEIFLRMLVPKKQSIKKDTSKD